MRTSTQPFPARRAVAAIVAAGLAGAAAAAGAPSVPAAAAHGSNTGHVRVVFPEPLRRLPDPADAASRARGSATFASEDGRFQLGVWETPNPGGQGRLGRPRPDAPPADGWRTTYRAGGDGWRVASGYTPGGLVFYERSDFLCGRRVIAGFVAVYPADAESRARFDPWMGRIRLRAERCDDAGGPPPSSGG